MYFPVNQRFIKTTRDFLAKFTNFVSIFELNSQFYCFL